MIEKLRKGLSSGSYSPKKILAVVIFGAIVLVFIFFGFPTRQTTDMGAVARVNNAYIPLDDYQKEVDRLDQMYRSLFANQQGGNPSANRWLEGQKQYIRSQALDNLISNELIRQGMIDMGIYVTDAEVRDVLLKELPMFQENGQFSRDRYKALMQANRLTPVMFEDMIRKDRWNQKARLILETLGRSHALLDAKERQLRESKVNLKFVRLAKADFETHFEKKTGLKWEAEIQKQKTDPNFQKQVTSYYEEHKSDYTQGEEVRAQHILIKIDKKSGSNGSDEALKKIKEIQEKAKTMDFGELAKKYSQDEGSRKTGGDLGFFGHGKMVPEFEAAAFAQNLGKVGEPVKSPHGYHLIKVVEKRPAKMSSLEAEEPSIAKKIIAGVFFNQEVKLLEEMAAKGDLALVDQKLQSLNYTWEETGPWSMNAEVVPKLEGLPAALDVVGEVSMEKPLLPRLLSDNEIRYLIKLQALDLKPLEVSSALLPSEDKNSDPGGGGLEYLSRWLEQKRRTAIIEKNTRVLQ